MTILNSSVEVKIKSKAAEKRSRRKAKKKKAFQEELLLLLQRGKSTSKKPRDNKGELLKLLFKKLRREKCVLKTKGGSARTKKTNLFPQGLTMA